MDFIKNLMILNQVENYKKKLVICVPNRNREKH